MAHLGQKWKTRSNSMMHACQERYILNIHSFSFLLGYLQIRDIEFTRDIHALLWSICSTCLGQKDDPRDEYMWKSMVIMQSFPEYDANVALSVIPRDIHMQRITIVM